ncbi:hypothetical protein [Conexibacter woesei]|uniref:hypothetical protein n=1 Tax=Conexibacter woesei TaxID=191495 RepID=UPI00047BA87A|nr:hypothetical protein [Conexibacter woesei]
MVVVDWPSETCVTAWVWTAMERRGLSGGDPSALARHLETHLPDRATPNPWGLAVSTAASHVGVRPRDAERLLPAYLQARDPDLAFRYAPVDVVAMDSHAAFLAEAMDAGVDIGAGMDVSRFSSRSDVLRHVVSVDGLEDRAVLLRDPVGQVALPSRMRVDDFVDLVGQAGGGFWLLGPREALLALRHVMPWTTA